MNEDDNLPDAQASDETLDPKGKQSEADPKDDTLKDGADTGTDGDGDADEGEADPNDEGDQDEEQPKRKRRSGVERLKRRNEALEAELSTLRSQPKVDGADLDAAVRAEIGEPPKESDFNGDYLAFERALTEYGVEKRLVTREVRKAHQGQAAQTAARQSEAFEEYNERLEEAAKAIPDLKKTITGADIDLRHDVIQLIVESEKGPLLAHHLAKNPAKANEINRMPPIKAAMEIARLETRLSLPKANGASKAPPPTNPLKGGAGPRPALGKSMSDYEKWRNS